MAFIESVALSLFAVVVVMIGSSVIHQSYSLTQILLHTALMVGAGVFLIAFGNLCYSLFPGDYLCLLITLVLLRRALPHPSNLHAASPLFRQNQLARIL